MSMASKSSDLVDETSGVNLQMEGHADVPPQGAKDLQESEASSSSPSHLPCWLLVRRLPSSHPNTKHCLEICVTLTEELGAVPPPSCSWMAPLLEDMLHDTRAFLFYGRHSMGEGLTMDKARGIAFLLTGVGIWVGKSTYLTTDPTTIQEGRQAIAQAIMDCQVKAMGPGHPCVNLLAQQPFRFDPPKGSPMKDASWDGGSNHQPSPHWPRMQ